jgi:predicted amidohydrolase
MRVSVLQFSPKRTEKEINFKRIEALSQGVTCDLLVLPELATTGYMFASLKELKELAEPFPGGETSDFLTRLARAIGGHVVSGVAEREGERIYNSAVLFCSKGHVGTYRKVHLFDAEKELFEAGNLGFPVFDTSVAKVGMMVCFDWIFPESARSLALGGAQVIAHPANLVLPYCPKAASTRALENHVFYLLADRTGIERLGDDKLRFIGKSRIIGTHGEVLCSLGLKRGLLAAEINPSLADNKQVTPHNDLLSDRRVSEYRL